jgi:DNA-binding transcriptional LysR family regulator
MHYTLHQLEIFTKVCELKSISKAAEGMHLTQPAISIQLKKLQDQFDIPLTEIIGRQLYVTDFGEKIRELSIEILDRASLIEETTNEYKGLVSGQLNIASVSTGKYVIPFFLNSFAKAHPKVDIVVDVTNKNLVVNSLSKNTTDFALVSVMPDMSLQKVKLMDNVLQLVGGPDFYHLGKKMTSKQLEEETLIFREKGSATRGKMEAFLKKKNITRFRSMELTSNEAVKQAVMAGLGFSLMPLIGLRQHLKLDLLRTFDLPGLPISTQWNLVWSKGKRFTPAAQAFIEHIKKNKQQIIEQYFES